MFLARVAPGSRLIFASIPHDLASGTIRAGVERLDWHTVIKHPLYRYGIAPEHVVDQLRQAGWAEREQVGRAELVTQCVEPAVRELAVYELERFVSAE